MTGPGPDRHKFMITLERSGASMNHRDASAPSGSHWRNPPTPIQIPAERPLRVHDNPYFRSQLNNLRPHPQQHRRPGNPNVLQTVLAKPPEGSGFGTDSRKRKRQKVDISIPSSITFNGTLSSYAGAPAARSSVSEPDVQVVESSLVTNKRSNPVPNDAEIIDLGCSSDDIGERVPRIAKSSSPDPILLTHKTVHPFEVRPTKYNSSASNKGKGRAKEQPEVVEASEDDEDISEFTPPPFVGRLSSARKSPVIPVDFVRNRKKLFESAPASTSVTGSHPVQRGVKSVDFITGTVVSKMRKKDEGALGHQRGTTGFDPVGTSSSGLLNSTREKEKITLPLEAWCLGQHLFQHSSPALLKLSYEVALQRIKVTWGRSPPEDIEFKLDRHVSSTMIVNDLEMPLRQNVVAQFLTLRGSAWKGAEGKYKGFEGGGERGRGAITLLFSTAQDRDFSPTSYQKLITGIKKACSVETISPLRGASVWEFASQRAAMLEQTELRNKSRDRNEGILDESSVLTRPVTPCSSTSVKTSPELKPLNGDSGPSMSHRRSTRQSAIRSLSASPQPPPLAQLEPDEVVLVYPPTGTGALSVMHSDLKRLQPEEYLNDTLIEFGLKLWLNDLREKDPWLANQVHVFSSFFYKKLNNKKNPEDGYKSVRKWTSKFDIFTKRYIIVPINENVHWYLAIIYEPGHTLEPPLPLLQASHTRITRKRKQEQESAKDHPETPTEVSLEPLSALAQVTTSPEIQMRDSSPNLVHPPSDSMDVDVDIDTSITDVVSNRTSEVAEVPEPSTSGASSGIPVNRFYGATSRVGDTEPVVVQDNEDSGEDQRQEAEVDNMLAVTQSSTGDVPSQTYIFTLDSLGTRHPQAIKVLKQYLRWEAKDKHNFDEVRDAVGKQVQVPVQPNTWDCGIYLLHFVKTFMSAPSEFVEQILSTRSTMPGSERKKMWQDHEIPHSRDYLKSRIVQLSEEWKAGKTSQDEANKQRSADAPNVEAVSSEGEVDIVEDVPSVKATSTPRQKQPAARLRG